MFNKYFQSLIEMDKLASKSNYFPFNVIKLSLINKLIKFWQIFHSDIDR